MKIRSETGLIRDLIKDEIVLAELSWQLSGNNGMGIFPPSASLEAEELEPECVSSLWHVYWTLWHLWTCSSLNLDSSVDTTAAGGHWEKTQQVMPTNKRNPFQFQKKFVGGSVRAHPKSPWALSHFLVM